MTKKLYLTKQINPTRYYCVDDAVNATSTANILIVDIDLEEIKVDIFGSYVLRKLY